jgi:hypothetical protein
VKLITHFQLVPRSRKRGFAHPPPHTPSWHGDQLVKHRDNFKGCPYIEDIAVFLILTASCMQLSLSGLRLNSFWDFMIFHMYKEQYEGKLMIYKYGLMD